MSVLRTVLYEIGGGMGEVAVDEEVTQLVFIS